MSKAVLYGVGLGPGDPELVTLKAVRILKECPVIAAPKTQSGAMMALDIAEGAVDLSGKTILPLSFAMSRDKAVLAQSHQAAVDAILAQLEQGNSVAMLNIGDVSIYSTFSYMKEITERAGYPVVMVPGVPSFCAVAAELGEDLTPQMDTPLHIIPAGFTNLDAALAYPGTKVIMKAGKPLEQLKQKLAQEGLYDKAKLVQNCGLPDQVAAYSLDDARIGDSYFTTMVVKP